MTHVGRSVPRPAVRSTVLCVGRASTIGRLLPDADGRDRPVAAVLRLGGDWWRHFLPILPPSSSISARSTRFHGIPGLRNIRLFGRGKPQTSWGSRSPTTIQRKLSEPVFLIE